MKQNPCRYCALSTEVFGKHYPRTCIKCMGCENLKKHKEYLKAHRKFVEGEPITNLSELLEQEWVMWNHHIKHIEFIKHMQLSMVLHWLKFGTFRKAEKKEEN